MGVANSGLRNRELRAAARMPGAPATTLAAHAYPKDETDMNRLAWQPAHTLDP